MEDLVQMVFRVVMRFYIQNPKDVMNVGLTCKGLRNMAHIVLKERAESMGINSYYDALKLGWPCVVKQHEPEHFLCKELFEACMTKNSICLKRLTATKQFSPVELLLLSTHPRAGMDSPLQLLDNYLLSDVITKIVH